jgi:hypothetical protein
MNQYVSLSAVYGPKGTPPANGSECHASMSPTGGCFGGRRWGPAARGGERGGHHRRHLQHLGGCQVCRDNRAVPVATMRLGSYEIDVRHGRRQGLYPVPIDVAGFRIRAVGQWGWPLGGYRLRELSSTGKRLRRLFRRLLSPYGR